VDKVNGSNLDINERLFALALATLQANSGWIRFAVGIPTTLHTHIALSKRPEIVIYSFCKAER